MKAPTLLPFALESAHGTAGVIRRVPKMRPDQLIIANLSGRGDKDVSQAAEFLLEGNKP
jgi:tryptophan synthase beta chain